MHAVRLQQITKRFDEKLAVDHLDLDVADGEFFGFLGRIGAGMSTTIKILCGLLRPDYGRAEVLGMDVQREPLAVRRAIGVLPEEVALYERLTPMELLRFTGRLHGLGRDEVDRRADLLLDLMELGRDERRKMVLDFSMGMRKKGPGPWGGALP